MKKISHKPAKYEPAHIEPMWQERWVKEKTYHPDIERSKKPYYALMMFPYPSAEGMHVGNMYAFTGSDIHGRFMRMQGNDVLEPIGLDGFGIHSENYALKIGRHPMDQAQIAEKNFYRQLLATGNSFDWDRRMQTYAPDYYAWTQWLFIQLFKAGLAYKKNAPVNFCPSCKTVLADEQVENGLCERCSSVVEKKDLEQWFFRITNYAEQLLANISELNWAEKVKIAQRKWIGKKDGLNITYNIKDSHDSLTIFTTRPDTNFGATFIALAPENPLALKIASAKNRHEVEDYINKVSSKSLQERQEEGREKTGVFTGAYAINELTGYEMPIWVSDFVLQEFGTGAVVGVPGHDKRDFEFAKKFGLEIIRVVTAKDGDASDITELDQVQEEQGTMVNSGFLTGLEIHEAKAKMMDYLEEKGMGEREVTYHLRDWLISRQRYWGAPIPMIFCESCSGSGKSWFDTDEAKEFESKNSKFKIRNAQVNKWAAGWYPVSDNDLPVELPHIENYKPLGTGKSPLATYPEFYETTCPGCGSQAVRETDVCDTFLDSSWYFLRYTSTDLSDLAFDVDRVKKWLPVNMYIGGAEHSVLHLLYARFVTMVLHDMGLIDFAEPFSKFYAHGLLIKEGAKMSKSKGNVIVPDEYIAKYGADTLRTYLMFLGPFSQGGDFYDSGIQGIYKFLKRVWKTYQTAEIITSDEAHEKRSLRNEIVKAVTEDLLQLRYNTVIAKLMTYHNALSKDTQLQRADAEAFLKMLAPFAPHLSEELWQTVMQGSRQSNTTDTFDSIHLSAWPTFDEKLIEQKEHVVAIQVNGKLRGSITISEDLLRNESEVTRLAGEQENVRKHLEGRTIVKRIYIPGKIVNFVIS